MKQKYSNFEIVVIDNGSTDGTSNLLMKYPLRTIRCKVKSKGYLRNLGWKNASGDVIVYIDDDAEVISSDWLEQILESFERFKGAGAVGGPGLTKGEQLILGLYYSSEQTYILNALVKIYNFLFLSGKLLTIGRFTEWGSFSLGVSFPFSINIPFPLSVDMLSTCNVGIRRSSLEELNGFDDKFIYNHEDGDLFLRMKRSGFPLIFNPKAAVFHNVSKKKETRAPFYLLGRDYGRFYGKDLHPSSIKGKILLSLNILLLNISFIYKAFEMHASSPINGIKGFLIGFLEGKRQLMYAES